MICFVYEWNSQLFTRAHIVLYDELTQLVGELTCPFVAWAAWAEAAIASAW
jgi:hypothetical protein